MFDKVYILDYVLGNMVCYISCFAAVGVPGAFDGPEILSTLGVTTTGIKPVSWAAGWMALQGGNVKAEDMFITLHAIGAKAIKSMGISYVKAVCNYLCYNE